MAGTPLESYSHDDTLTSFGTTAGGHNDPTEDKGVNPPATPQQSTPVSAAPNYSQSLSEKLQEEKLSTPNSTPSISHSSPEERGRLEAAVRERQLAHFQTP
jgi:hypothetical protein